MLRKNLPLNLMITIYHNPRCRKSREALAYIMDHGWTHKIVAYLSHPLRIEEIVYLTELLDLKAIDLVRTQEALWRDHYKNESLTEDQIIELLSAHPKLLQRPIVVIGKRAVIARPAELIESIR